MFKRFRIGTKLIAAFSAIALITAAIGLVGIFNLNNTTALTENLYTEVTAPLVKVADISQLYQRTRVILRDIILMPDMAGKQSEIENLKSKDEQIDQLMGELGAIVSDEDREMYERIKNSLEAYRPLRQKVIDRVEAGDPSGAYTLLSGKETDDAAMAVQTAISDFDNESSDNGNSLNEANTAANTSTKLTTITVTAFGIVLSVVLGILFSLNLSRPIRKITKAADNIAKGNMDVKLDIKSGDETGQLAQSFKKMVGAIKAMIADTNMLSEAAINGEFETRADTGKHAGDYKKIVEGINNTLDTVVDKIFWYEGLLDAIPLPISVTDMDMNWTFINKPVEQFLGIKRNEVLGKQCDNWNAAICNTENCGIARLRSGQARTEFDQMGGNFQVDTSYILDRKGEKAGHIEVVQEITERVKVAQYTNDAVKRLAHNLQLLAEGNLQLDFAVAEGDKYTEETQRTFGAINADFRHSIEAISGYIGEISRVLSELSKGNMTEEIEMEFAGDFAQIKDSINSIAQSLNTVLHDISNAAEQVAAGTKQVSDGSQALSQGATEQASSIEELTSSITEIAAQTRQNAANATEASQLATVASTSATKGNEQMKDMLTSMDEINESSASISKIIKVIDDIAFQTNILALNAAVEAARAGAYGKGFAVVAEEVRNLAAKSAEAAKETTTLIEGSIRKVEQGTKYANDTAKALGEILGNAERVATLVSEIAVASNEQATGIAQVNKGIEQVSQVVQSTSATAEESAAASEELSGQAELLHGMVAQFKLKSDRTLHAASAGALPEKPKAEPANRGEFGKY